VTASKARKANKNTEADERHKIYTQIHKQAQRETERNREMKGGGNVEATALHMQHVQLQPTVMPPTRPFPLQPPHHPLHCTTLPHCLQFCLPPLLNACRCY